MDWDEFQRDLMDFRGFQWILSDLVDSDGLSPIWVDFCGSWWASIDLNRFQWIWTDSVAFWWIVKHFDGFQWILVDSNWFQLILIDVNVFKWKINRLSRLYWIVMDFNGFSRIFWIGWILVDIDLTEFGGLWWMWISMYSHGFCCIWRILMGCSGFW